MQKIIRSICHFSDQLDLDAVQLKQKSICKKLETAGFEVQTQRLCLQNQTVDSVIKALDAQASKIAFIALGNQNRAAVKAQLPAFIETDYNISFNLALDSPITAADVEVLFEIIKKKASKTFNFSFSFNNPVGSPYFPASNMGKKGFALGLQSTNLAQGCTSLDAWFSNQKATWASLMEYFEEDLSFLGIDSSIAPLEYNAGSFIQFITQLKGNFERACSSSIFTECSNFIKMENPKPTGLCGLMFPCLEDFVLADLYEAGQFSIERNIFLSLHSGLGIDTYPIGIDESPERILEVLQLLQALSNKYKKPLAARFISDGKTKIGSKSNFQNAFLKDICLRPL
jgi:hypothetical protein